MFKYRERRFCSLYFDQLLLLKQGAIVWASLVQANNLLFKPGENNHPANIVYSADPVFHGNLEELGRIARELYELKEKQLNHPEVADLTTIAQAITNEMDRLLNIEISDSLTAHRIVYFTTIMVHRKHLPFGYLNSGWFPILIAPDKTTAVMLLPSRYWSPSLLKVWCAD
jgi:hypothetical protein